MTLQKTKKKPAASHQLRRTGQHHKLTRKYHTPYWPYLPMVTILVFGFVAQNWFMKPHSAVLGYATDMSIQSLLDDTNQQRASNGESILSLNGQLDQAAQAKANDMATRDYWSHNTPDGQTPWTFMTAAGYSYHTAGENLAYGFSTAADTITGWMNSAGHRANILNTSFVEVGFGVANAANYQGSGPQTIVVAMYASPAVAAAPAPAPTPPFASAKTSAPVASAPVATATPTTSEPESTTASPQTASGQSAGAATKTKAKDVPATTQPTTAPSPEPKQERLSQVQLAAGMSAGVTVMSVAVIAGALLLYRHSRAWHKRIKKGEKFILHHPAFDIAAVTLVVLCVLASQTSGLIR